MDGASRFVLRVRKLYYYRIELPEGGKDDAEETKKVEELKAVLGKILKYEVTPCPFKRGFHVELPASAITPRRRGKWERKDGTFSTETTPGSGGSGLPRLRSARQWSRRAVSHGKVGINGGGEEGKRQWAQAVSPLAMRSKLAGGDINGEKAGQERSETPDSLDEEEPLSGSTEVGEDEYLEQQELGSKHQEDGTDEDELDNARTTKNELNDENEDEAPNHILPASEEARPNHSNIHLDADEDQLSVSREQDSDRMRQAEAHDPETVISEEASHYHNGELSEGPNQEADSTHDDEKEAEVDSRTDPTSNGWTSEPGYSLLKSSQADLLLPAGADSVDQGTETKEAPIDSHFPEEDDMLPPDESDHATDETLPDGLLTTDSNTHDDVPPQHLDEEESQASQIDEQDQDDSLSKVSSIDSFHTISPDNDNEYDSSRGHISESLLARPNLHKREVSELTVTGHDHTSDDIHPDPETPPEGLLALPPSTSTSATNASSTQLGLRNRLQTRRTHSPPPPQSTLSSPQTYHSSSDKELLRRAASLALSTPIEVVLFVVHVLAKIAGGATINDLLSGELFRRPEQRRRRRRTSPLPEQLDRNTAEEDEGEEEEDEDDFGMPIRTRRRTGSGSAAVNGHGETVDGSSKTAERSDDRWRWRCGFAARSRLMGYFSNAY